MANSRQKSLPEATRRSPGKSKFSIPRKEAPPIDGSYLDRLFADYERQAGEGAAGPLETAQAQSLPQPPAEDQKPEASSERANTALPADSHPPPAALQPAHTLITQRPARKKRPAAVRVSDDDPELLQKIAMRHRLSRGEANVLRALLRMCQEANSDTCYIKVPQLAGIIGLKDRQTQRVLKSLSQLQLIERVAEYSNADRLGLRYRVIPLSS